MQRFSLAGVPRALVAVWLFESQYGSMTNVQIKDVPEVTHAILRARAAAAHQSLQEYLRSRLIEEASLPTVDEVLTRAAGRAGGAAAFDHTLAAIRDDRDRR